MAKHGRGVRTRQFNPRYKELPKDYLELLEWRDKVKAEIDKLQTTRPIHVRYLRLREKRLDALNKQIAKRFKELTGQTLENPGGAVNLAQYVMAAMEHSRGAHDAGGKILHETPKAKRREFAKEIWWRRGYRNPVHLQGMGDFEGTPAGDLKPGMRLYFNYGIVHRVVKVEPAGSKSVIVTTQANDGKQYTKRYLRTRAVVANPPRDIMREFHAGKLRTSAGKLVKRTKQGLKTAKAILLSELRRAGRIPARSNPSADAAYETFHGRAPDKIKVRKVALIDPYNAHPNLWQLGKLKSLTVGEFIEKMDGRVGDQPHSANPDAWAEMIEFDQHNAPDLAGEPGGRQLFIVGGDQNVDRFLERLRVDPAKDPLDCGFVYRIEYFTRKDFDQFRPVDYWHHFGEETHVQPRLIYDRTNHRLQLAGGEYVVKREGIVN